MPRLKSAASRQLGSLGSALVLGATLAWPFIMVFGRSTVDPHWLAAGFTMLLLLRLFASDADRYWKLGGALLAVAGAAGWALSRDDRLLTAQPVVINLALCVLFGASLWRGMPLIERIARARDMPVAPFNLGYLRTLTAVWAGFFALAGSVSAWTVWFADPAIWLLWNGCLVYIATGVLLLGELPVRRWFRHRHERARQSTCASPGSPLV